jgi:hypothetical protein
MKTLGLWLIMAGAALAQDRGTERQVTLLKERLGLNDEQTAKVREIFAKEQADREKLDEDRVAKIKDLLTDEQKPKYEELRQQGGRAFRGAGQPGAPGGFGGFGNFGRGNQFQLENLKAELGLTDEQVEKIKPIIDEQTAAMTKRMEELRQQGFQGLDWQAELGKMQEAIKSTSDKVKVHLNDEQKTKLDAQIERATAMFRMIPGLAQGRGGFGAPPTPTRPSAEERVRRAVEALKIEKEDERAAIRSLIEKVVKAQDALEDYLKSSRDRAGEAARNSELSEQALEDRLGEVRKERRRLEKELSDLQGQLADVVSVRQEAELVQQSILK